VTWSSWRPAASEGHGAEPAVDLGRETAAVYGVEREATGWAGMVGEDLGDHRGARLVIGEVAVGHEVERRHVGAP
jgi:hypothetical protein